jgi:SAM-dependent methyltransferase
MFQLPPRAALLSHSALCLLLAVTGCEAEGPAELPAPAVVQAEPTPGPAARAPGEPEPPRSGPGPASEAIDPSMPAYYAAVVQLETALREGGDRATLEAAAQALEDALVMAAAQQGLSLDPLLGDAEPTAGATVSYPYALVPHISYLAFARERLGDATLRERAVKLGALDPEGHAFHFETLPVDEVIRFELLDACLENIRQVESALRRWSEDNGGRYPERLEQLVPAHLPSVPSCPVDGVSYDEHYSLVADGADFQLVCDNHQQMNGKDLVSSAERSVPVNPQLEQRYKIYPMLLGPFLDMPRQQQFLGPLVEAAGLEAGMTVADVGAGAGLFTVPFAETVGPKGKVYAVDINASVLALVDARVAARPELVVETVLAVRQDSGLPDGAIDAAFVIQTYHSMPNPQDPANEQNYQEMIRPWLVSVHTAMAPGGKLVIQDGMDKLDTALVEDQVTRAGFEHLGTTELGQHQFIAVFQRP